MKVLNVEDNAMKHYQIKRALEYCGAKEVDCLDNLQEGLERLKETWGTEKQYDLLITDMNYPLVKGGISDGEAGEKLIQILREEEIAIPTIICSTRRFTGEGVLGSVWYNSLRDIEEDFREILSKLK